MNVSCGFHGAGTTIISARVHTCLAAYDKQHKHNVHCRSGDKLLNGFAAKHATTDWGMSGLMFLSQTVRYCQRTCVMSMCAIVNVSSYLNACMRVSSLKAPHVPVISKPFQSCTCTAQPEVVLTWSEIAIFFPQYDALLFKVCIRS